MSWIGALVAACAVAAVLLSRARPGIAAAVAGAASVAASLAHPLTGTLSGQLVWPVAEAPPLLVLTVLAVRLAPPRWAVLGGGLSGLAVALVLLKVVWPEQPSLVFGACAAWGLGAVAAAAVGLYLRSLDARRVRAVAEATRLQRLSLARDLHDFVAHDVSGMLVQAQAAAVIAGPLPEPVAEALRRIEEAGQRALAALDRTVHLLNEPGPGIEGIAALADGFSPAVRVELSLVPAAEVPGQASALAYRVVSEALTNVRRHAPRATAVAVTVAREGRRLLVRVANDGADDGGAGGTRNGGFGLPGLARLLESRGGSLTAGPHGGGWLVTADIPVEGEGQ
ncbi:sensor histidine kinase [Thermoactinospora rubra]|uniref:sensor histidine kinase n=1 Tax=Thermoactinospora rubra TaxID=1088767 RepID=UPI000A0FC2EA|nr:histidine kinase [Thermoactinospora rubra]